MQNIYKKPICHFLIWICVACQPASEESSWQLTGFVKSDINPVLWPDTTSRFYDSLRQQAVKWEGKDVFNPASIVRNDTLFLLYRAEDFVGKHNGTSRVGLAWSLDGIFFERYPEPVLYPEEDAQKLYEWEGGIEDPRIVEDENGMYVMTYTAYDGETARLMVATSKNLKNWEKHGPAFIERADFNKWSKSGSILCRKEGGRLVAERISGQYWMYFGDTDIFLARSQNLTKWTPIVNRDGDWQPVLMPRKGYFDSDLVEPGPPAIITQNGVLLFYNGRNKGAGGDPNLAEGTYSAGQALFHPDSPSELVSRAEEYFMTPDQPFEMTGQVNYVCFIEGLSFYKEKWLLYYGTADSKIGVAISKADL